MQTCSQWVAVLAVHLPCRPAESAGVACNLLLVCKDGERGGAVSVPDGYSATHVAAVDSWRRQMTLRRRISIQPGRQRCPTRTWPPIGAGIQSSD
ncbi:hypothetical protein PF005_g4399 [Phytophthora fragariae]|uniref:Secreted protein n=1 Tax=Phytophthora fragariae TaxID=53985 RepID=A0A6A3TAY2_9STRA|nr:hypothetical protein PF003_g3096 [Phytophthora fragariae]KAE8949526.1 hypothetical protein PF009_g932 [Phytophthora fragariae]KAE9014091.1 hypothetical protein PF011_g8217 [Phytophthora fragariae]KAE9117448.1 hypothetical protein PF010_g8610 [Phytophthora fragariae]KAE9130658.1 hypothetical protein PF007_g4432 [Phytophthora fragariae]